jgi:HSP20 family protein
VIGVATRFDPFQELERFVDQAMTGSRSGALVPMDLFRAGDHYVIRVDLPGADPGSIDVSVDDRMLTIRGQRTATDSSDVQWLMRERPSGAFARQIALGRGISSEDITATYTDGVLSLTVPVAQDAKPRRIEVTHGKEGSSQRTIDAGTSEVTSG